MTPRPRFVRPPQVVRRPRITLDNLALVPASLLPYKEEWQTIANGLPPGDVLFVVPAQETPMKQQMRRVAMTLRSRGRGIAVVTSDHLD